MLCCCLFMLGEVIIGQKSLQKYFLSQCNLGGQELSLSEKHQFLNQDIFCFILILGRRNYRHFFMFLISLSLHMTSIFILCLVHVLHKKEDLSQVPMDLYFASKSLISLYFYFTWLSS